VENLSPRRGATDENYQPSADAIEALARCLLPAIRSYFESEEGHCEFADWQARKGNHSDNSPAEEVNLDRAG
jgi:hypothetical protein